ncbi:AAA family ATPase [Stygiolobus caldivivus]|nr:AAA family ATPase [Stygiolobus caldivivus]
MRVAIENFGPIRSANFELCDTTIVIGPNASGKSFISTLLYSVLRAVSPSIREIRGGYEVEPEAKLSSYLKAINEALSEDLKGWLEILFGVKYKELISYDSKEAKVSFTSPIGGLEIKMSEKFEAKIVLNKDFKVVTNVIEMDNFPANRLKISSEIDIENEEIEVNVYTRKKSEMSDISTGSVLSELVNYLGELLFGDYIPVVMLPTERNLVVVNLLSYLNASVLSNTASDKPVIRYFIGDLLFEMEMLRGKEFSLKMGHIDLRYKVLEPFVLEIYEKGHKVPVSLLSSGYSQVIPIDIMASESEFIMIEEPELNLHAGAQRDMADYLSNLVQRGKKLFLTTHSDIFTVQMAVNHVRNGKDKPFKIYLLNNGTMEEVEYTEKGDVESIPTITDVIREQIKEIYGE